MKKVFWISFISLSLVLSGCSVSMEDDAKQAAKLNKESLEAMMDNDLSKAEKKFKESEDIINKYKGTDKFDEFNALYHELLLNPNSRRGE